MFFVQFWLDCQQANIWKTFKNRLFSMFFNDFHMLTSLNVSSTHDQKNINFWTKFWSKNQSKIDQNDDQSWASIFDQFLIDFGTILGPFGPFGDHFGWFGGPKGVVIIGKEVFWYLFIAVWVPLEAQEPTFDQFWPPRGPKIDPT